MVVQTVASLRKSCKKMGITGYSGLNKAQLMRKCGSPKKSSKKKSSKKKYPSLPQYTAPAVRSGTLSSPPKKKRSTKKRSTKKYPSLPQYSSPAGRSGTLGTKVPWVFPHPKSDDSPPSYESLYGGKSMAFRRKKSGSRSRRSRR